MYDDIQNPPQPLAKSKFRSWYWLFISPIYLLVILWARADSVVSWAILFAPSNLPSVSISVIIFAVLMLIWLSFELSKGFRKLTECSQYEVYLAEVFENRDRQRPAQNAMRLDYLRKLRKMNSEVRGATENSQQQLLRLVIIGLLILLAGSIGQLTSQLVLS